MTRRRLLRLLPAATASIRFAGAGSVAAEDDPNNTKIAHRINARQITDDDLAFLRQIGLKWARLEFGNEDTPLDYQIGRAHV